MENKTTIPKRPKYAKLFLIVLSTQVSDLEYFDEK